MALDSQDDSQVTIEEKLQRSESEDRMTLRLAVAVFASVIGCSFQFGFQTGVLNTPQQLLQREYKYGFTDYNVKSNGTVDSSPGNPLSDDQVTLLWSVTVSIYAAGGMIGGFTGSYFATKLGRKKVMLLNNLLLLVGATLMLLTRFTKEIALMIAGRTILGINSGFSTVVVSLYLAEISPVRLRGGVGTINQLGVTLGILISQTLGLQQIFGSIHLYHFLFGVPFVAALLQLIILPFCPESPSWLFITKNRVEDSKKALQTLRGEQDVELQLNAYATEVEELKTRSKLRLSWMFTQSHLRAPLLIAVVMQLSQQLSGIIASVGLVESDAQYATLGTTGSIVTMTVISVMFVDKIGRRPLHLGGLLGCLVSMVLLTVALFTQVTYDWAKYLSIVSLLVFLISFAVGPGSIPWFITAELFDQTARPYAIALATLVNWSANFVSGLVFPHMQAGMGHYVFIPFVVLLVLFVLFTYFKVPETKNKSTEEILAIFQTSASQKNKDSQLRDMSIKEEL